MTEGFEKQRYDGLNNAFYGEAEYEQLLKNRVSEFNEEKKKSNLTRAGILLTRGHIADRFADEQVEGFFDELAGYWLKRGESMGENASDFSVALSLAAISYSDCLDVINNRSDKARVGRIKDKRREIGKRAYDIFLKTGKFRDALRCVGSFELEKSLGKEAARSYIREILTRKNISPEDKKECIELANRYGIEDEDVLEKLTS